MKLRCRHAMNSSTYRNIYAAVSRIPRGQVATYGQIALLAGLPGRARQVGYALSALNDPSVPWHRVINAKGEISPRSGGSEADELQRLRLEDEGIRFDSHGRIPLHLYRWRPQEAFLDTVSV
ncbi:MGMT family protein [Geomonas diazotrophica]